MAEGKASRKATPRAAHAQLAAGAEQVAALLSMHPRTLARHHADASAFTRAFRRWSGTTPAEWRAARAAAA
jgi:AraC-like DNA-binding protein